MSFDLQLQDAAKFGASVAKLVKQAADPFGLQGQMPKPANTGGYKIVQQTSGVLPKTTPAAAPTAAGGLQGSRQLPPGQVKPPGLDPAGLPAAAANPVPTTQFDPAAMGPSAPYGGQQFPVQAGMRLPSGARVVPGIGTMPSNLPDPRAVSMAAWKPRGAVTAPGSLSNMTGMSTNPAAEAVRQADRNTNSLDMHAAIAKHYPGVPVSSGANPLHDWENDPFPSLRSP